MIHISKLSLHSYITYSHINAVWYIVARFPDVLTYPMAHSQASHRPLKDKEKIKEQEFVGAIRLTI